MQFYMRRANTSQQDVPPLSRWPPLLAKSSPYHKCSTCPEVTVRGLENTDRTSSGDSELYPGILDHLRVPSVMNWLAGKRIPLVEVVMTTSTWSLKLLYAPQPQWDQYSTLVFRHVTYPYKWTSLIASKRPLDGTENLPNWLSFAPKHTGTVFSLIQGSVKRISHSMCYRFRHEFLRKTSVFKLAILKKMFGF